VIFLALFLFLLVIWFFCFCASYGRSARQVEQAREREELKRRSALRSELQMSRSRFHLPNVPNQLTQHTKEESFRTSIPCPAAFAPDGGGRIFAKGVTLSGEKRA
jgi:hypothetical protein